jgi:hypothetical protein
VPCNAHAFTALQSRWEWYVVGSVTENKTKERKKRDRREEEWKQL